MNSANAHNVPENLANPTTVYRPLRIITEPASLVGEGLQGHLRHEIDSWIHTLYRIFPDQPQFPPPAAEVIKDKGICPRIVSTKKNDAALKDSGRAANNPRVFCTAWAYKKNLERG